MYEKQLETAPLIEEEGDLGQDIKKLMDQYLAKASTVTSEHILTVARSTYSLALKRLKEKVTGGATLSIQEQDVYKRCEEELKKYNSLLAEDSLWSVYFNSIEIVLNCYTVVQEWFGVESTSQQGVMSIVQAGRTLLPNYATLLSQLFCTFADLFAPPTLPTVVGFSTAQAKCACSYQQSPGTIDKPMVADMLVAADYAYSGCTSFDKFKALPTTDVPRELQPLYNPDTGLLIAGNGLRLWLGTYDGKIVVAFSGTIVTDWSMCYADILQLSAPSLLYLKAAGVLKLMLSHYTDKTFLVAGHSLGGGLTQFAVTANIMGNENRITGYAFNPAGLSLTSLSYLGGERLEKVVPHIQVFKTCMDLVSLFGGKLGTVITLPKTETNGHGMADLMNCMKEYVKQTTQQTHIAASGSKTLSLRYHPYRNDFIPYTLQLSVQDEQGTVYPMFSSDASSASSVYERITLSEELFQQLSLQTTTVTECLGIYNQFNGSVHTALNRLSLLNHDAPIVQTNSAGDRQSTLLYGKYGLGVSEFLADLQTKYITSGDAFTNPNQNLDLIVSHLYNPFEEEKKAWCSVIALEFGYDINLLFETKPLAEGVFDLFLLNFHAARLDSYHSIYQGGTPTKDQQTKFYTSIKKALINGVRNLFINIRNYVALTAEQKEQIISTITRYMDVLINL